MELIVSIITHTQHTKMPLSALDRAMTTDAYNIENNLLNKLLKKQEEGGKVNPWSIKTSKITRAIYVHALNGDKEKAQHKLSKYIQHCQEVMEDMLEDRDNASFTMTNARTGTKETISIAKDGGYKVMCDYNMKDITDMRFLVKMM